MIDWLGRKLWPYETFIIRRRKALSVLFSIAVAFILVAGVTLLMIKLSR